MSRALQHKLALIADLVLPGYSSMDRAVDAPIAHAFMHWLVSRGRELSTGYQASRVGKTSLVSKYCQGSFKETERATVQAAFNKKRVLVGDRQVELGIWDTAGQERFHSIQPLYYRDANAALLVFDLTDSDSLERVRAWVTELQTLVGPHIVLTVLGNKADLGSARAVPAAESRGVAAAVGAAYFEVSALTGAGVEAAFADTARRALARKEQLAAEAAAELGASPGVPSWAGDRPSTVQLGERSRPQRRPPPACC